jgi:hypothetical protein
MSDEEFQAIRQRMRQDFSPTPVIDQPDTSTAEPDHPPREPDPVTASAAPQEPEPVKQPRTTADPGEPSDKW